MGNKCVLMSIRPQWCEKICRQIGTESRKPVYEKTLEIRKTRPKLETPFKCYIYCTLSGSPEAFVAWGKDAAKWNRENWWERKGKVIGEFVCDEIYQYSTGNVEGQTISSEEIQKQSCLTYNELCTYENSAEPRDFCIYLIGLYGWHISALQIYGKPRELSEYSLIRPPQSWRYVEELEAKR